MYLSFYGLEREPFHITPDPDFLYLSPSHKEAFATIVYGVEQRKGFVALTGEVGTGKTTVLRAYLKRVDSSKIRAIYLFNPSLTFQDLLRILLRELGVEHPEEKHEPTMLEQLQWALLKEYEAKRNVALIVDEAQNMPMETLERMRMLSNLETTQDKLLQIVLVGQPELDELLGRHELRQLTQRIAVKAHIRALSAEESEAYVAHRLMQAGCIREQVFSNGALKAIVRHCQGTPRALNIACDNALIAGFGGQEEVVSLPTAKEVLRDLGGIAGRRPKAKPLALGVGLAAAVVVLLSLALFSGGSMSASDLPAEEPVRQAARIIEVSEGKVVSPSETPPPTTEPEAVADESAMAALPPSEVEEHSAESAAALEEAAPVSEDSPAPRRADSEERTQLAVRSSAPMDTREIALERIAAQSRVLESSLTEQTVAESSTAETLTESIESTASSEESVEVETATMTTAATIEETVQPLEAVADEETAPVRVAAATEEGARPVEEAEAAPLPETEPESNSVADVTIQTVDSTVSSGVEAPKPFGHLMDGEVIHKAVIEGDQLLRILVQVYGFHSPPLVAAVLERNPQIEDMDYIRAGDTLILPAPEELNLAEGRKQSNSDRNPS